MDFLFSALAVIASFLSVLVPSHALTYTALPWTPSPPRATILFGGDMMFDRTVRTTTEERGGGFLFSCIDPVLRSADIVVANLEGPITSNTSVSVGTLPGADGNYTFTFPTSTASLLATHNIRLVSLGNNHIMNFGREGLLQTEDSLREADVAFFGDPVEHTIGYTTLKDIPLAFIGYNEFGGEGSASTRESIDSARAQGYLPIVFSHWGVEYSDISLHQRVLARQFIDAGAVLVVGAHPHVIQERELYRGAYIYYSLGNFLFDQYWDDAVRRGLLLKVTFTRAGVSRVEEIPIYNQSDRRPCAE